jgi:membrane-anchored protein YejM (alkaline phosphatase superfamily)
MLQVFGQNDLLEDTLFVLVGDHGEAFGEHGVFAHNSSVYEEEVAVPLVFWTADGSLDLGRLPDCRQIDIAPTIADLFGISGDLPVQGESLLRLRAPPAIFMSTFFDGSALALLEPPLKFIYEPASEQLARFDLSVDPLERQGTAVQQPRERQAVIRRLQAFQAYQRAAF